jgi:SAM-dependent methyltransferase
LERHRVQFLVLEQILADLRTADLRMLHIAPEPFFREFFSKRFGRYETADLVMAGVDHKVDLRELPFENEAYDLVFASHVLEHIRDDDRALAEIRRILRPNGIAILPVPIVAHETVEYPEPNPSEAHHVRAPGVDYFRRYERHFARVVRFSSDLLPAKHQPFIYEDRTQWPTEASPLRPAMLGERHVDIVPVCYASPVRTS